MLFGGCPCSRCIAYRRSYCCVEQSETVFEQVVFRCQFLPVFVKRRPSCPDTILDFGRFLLLECNQLAWVSHAFTSCQDFNFNIVDLHFFFRFRAKAGCWEHSSFLGGSWDPLFQYFPWIRTTFFFEADPWRLRTKARRRRTSGLCGSRGRGRSGRFPFLFFFCQRWVTSFSITSLITSVTWGVETSLCSTVPPEMRLERDCLDDNIVSVTRDMVERGNSVNFFVAHRCVLAHFAWSISCFWCVTCNSGATLCFTERPLILPLRLVLITLTVSSETGALLRTTIPSATYHSRSDSFTSVLLFSAPSLTPQQTARTERSRDVVLKYRLALLNRFLFEKAPNSSPTRTQNHMWKSTTISFPPHDQNVLLNNWINHLHPDLKHARQPSDTEPSSHSSLSSFAPSSSSWGHTFLWNLHVWSVLGHVRRQWRENHNIYRTQPRIICWSPPTGRIRIKCKIKNCTSRYRGAVFSVCHPPLPWRHARLCNFTTISAANPLQKLFLTLHRRASACSACRGLRGCTSLTRHLNPFHLLIRFGLLIKLQNSCTFPLFTPCSWDWQWQWQWHTQRSPSNICQWPGLTSMSERVMTPRTRVC